MHVCLYLSVSIICWWSSSDDGSLGVCVYDSKHVAAGVSCVCVCIIWFVTTQSNGCFRLLFVFGSLYKLYMVLHVFYSLAVHTNDMYTCIRRLSFFSLSLWMLGWGRRGELKIVYYAGVGGGVSQRVNTLRDTVLSYTESPRRASH